MLPLATTFSVSVPLTRLTVPRPASCNADRVTVSLLVLPVSVSTFVTVPRREVHRRAVGKDDRSVALPLAPPSIDSPAANSPLARLIVSLPAAGDRSCRRRPAGDGIGLALPVIEKASVWPVSVIVTPAAAVAAEIASTPWIDALVAPRC